MSAAQRLLMGVLLATVVGCQSLRQSMLAADYPPAFVDGFEAGCNSGRAAAGPLGGFEKAVTRYQAEPLYAQGWDDGFRQCEQAQHVDQWQVRRDDDRRDREWRHHVDQAMAKALNR
ncbi:conserved hypothetical protein [Pseudomonas sp. 8Z]|uniref:hypothetical protein n=1 Tax=Pseudomonas sp. 8Z TaxID=2653166 RepID=UPI0012F15E08|nr:hypothetical protein [Pseudomonas sp. 8Z]VXD01685.1 conserved hypothetical protein [Pseudomonas sp. 8Z]